MEVICPTLGDWGIEVKEKMHVKQLAQDLCSPFKVQSLLKIKIKLFCCCLDLVLLLIPILQSASEATWSNVVIGNKDRWEGRGQC